MLRQLIGAGTPKELAARGARLLWLIDPDIGLLVIIIMPTKPTPKSHFLNGLLTARRRRHPVGTAGARAPAAATRGPLRAGPASA